jgi:hypothetical protein
MQAEAGQQLKAIIARKELERQAGEGLFVWGVGNAPGRMVSLLARLGKQVDAIFSVMKTKPSAADVRPVTLLVWRSFVDVHGIVRPLPDHTLVTSRGHVSGGRKRSHYALMCHSADPIALGDHGPFDPAAYRNAGSGAPVGASQVTALLKRCTREKRETNYRISFRAKLTGGYWVKLADPIEIIGAKRVEAENRLATANAADWRNIVGDIREGDTVAVSNGREDQSPWLL